MSTPEVEISVGETPIGIAKAKGASRDQDERTELAVSLQWSWEEKCSGRGCVLESGFRHGK